ncbi:MAG: uracil phosphoribosyltransferase [Chloroflexi bacterium]|jgi:uracil phosphoribosyltransferase|nr:uracil phosphoribosyltransferase [Chloroflexota bacterium]
MATIHVSEHPLVKHKLTLLRDQETDPKKFRELIREITILLAYEVTKDLQVESVEVETPMAPCKGFRLQEPIGLIPILRAGLGMVEGIWEMIPSAEVWHIGLFRDEQTLRPVAYYNRLPVHPTVSVCLILDPMLATGGSAVKTVNILKEWGARRIKFMGLIGAPEGVENLNDQHPDVDLYLATVDDHLDENGFIIPGLGDAGDRQFGTG